MNSILAAAIGLSSLSAPSPPSPPSPPSDKPSTPNVKATAPASTLPQAKSNGAVSRSEIAFGKSNESPVGNEEVTWNSIAIVQAYYLRESFHRSSFLPSTAVVGDFDFGRSRRPFSSPYSDVRARISRSTAMAVDQFSVADRVNAMERTATTIFSSYYPNYPVGIRSGGASAPLLPPATLNPTIAVSPILSTKNFPETLYDIISVVDYSHIIAWLPHGRAFFIHDRQRFASEILTRFFDGAKFTSFTRRLKRWNYARVPRGPEMGAYYNPNFKRDQPDLVRKMRYRMEGEDDKVADEAEENLEDQSELEVVKKDNENPPQKTSGPPMPLQDTSPKRLSKNMSSPSLTSNQGKTSALWAIIEEHLEKEVAIRQKGAVKNDSPTQKSLSDSVITSLAEADDHLMPLPSPLLKRPKKRFKISTATRMANHGDGSGSSAGGALSKILTLSTTAAESSLLPQGHLHSSAMDDLYERMNELQREILARSMALAISLSGHSAPHDIGREERIQRSFEADRVTRMNRYLCDFPSSSSDVTSSSEQPSFIQGSGGMRANTFLRTTVPFEGSIGMSVPSLLRGGQGSKALPVPCIHRHLAGLQSSGIYLNNVQREVALVPSVEACLSGVGDLSRSVILALEDEVKYARYMFSKKKRGGVA